MQTWMPVSEVANRTGLIFGHSGEPVLSVAVDLAVSDQGRQIGVIAVNHPAGVAEVADRVVGAVHVRSSDEWKQFVQEFKQGADVDGVIVYGLDTYAQIILSEITDGQPTQADWGLMARRVANDLRALMSVFRTVFATCDVVFDDDGERRLNIPPGLMKLVAGDLYLKRFVVTTKTPEGEQTLVQENNALALRFVVPRPEGVAAAVGAAVGGRRRRE